MAVNNNSKTITIQCRSAHLQLMERTHVMGILNVTPDSFSDGGLYSDPEAAIERALAMADEGADIIDIGGESTRPGAEEVTINEEIQRTIPVIEGLRGRLKIPISIDTRKSEVARSALQAGAEIVNDVSGLCHDSQMIPLVAKHEVPVVIMHMKGTPKTMQINPQYNNLMDEITKFLASSIKEATKGGIHKDRIIIDPGIGFGKSWKDNFAILNHLNDLHVLGCPLLVGVSRKTFIGKLLDLPESKRIMGTAAAVAASILGGARLVRVHDVKEIIQVTRVVDEILKH